MTTVQTHYARTELNYEHYTVVPRLPPNEVMRDPRSQVLVRVLYISSTLAAGIDSKWNSTGEQNLPYIKPPTTDFEAMDYQNIQTEQDKTSYLVSRSVPDIDGFCHDYTLRRHKYEQNANEGSSRCRDDWRKYIGPIERWGSCNPFDGHFASVVLPLCKPERLALVSYVFECK